MRALALVLLLPACEGAVSGQRGVADAGVDECCLRLRCAPGQECFECTCRDSECCAALGCVEDLQVCVHCACTTLEDDPGADGGGGDGVDRDGDGFDADRDCDDDEEAVNPAAAETCNQADDDCDGSTDEDACPGGHCCEDGCHECCDEAECDDDDGCTADGCAAGTCQHVRPECAGDCCVELCEETQAGGCGISGGGCGDFCSALSSVQGDAGCGDERDGYEGCLAVCDDACAADCDDLGESLARCVGNYCAGHFDDPDCQTLLAAFQ